MARVVIIEDEFHAEWHGRFSSVNEAFAELKHRAAVPWDQSPNRCPCTNWNTCHRNYTILEYDDSSNPWKLLRRLANLEISSKGPVWSGDFADGSLSLPAS